MKHSSQEIRDPGEYEGKHWLISAHGREAQEQVYMGCPSCVMELKEK